MCLDVINQTWSPMYDMINIFEVFLPQLLRYPNPTDPLNGEAAALLIREPKGYETKVKGACRPSPDGAGEGRGLTTGARVRAKVRHQGRRRRGRRRERGRRRHVLGGQLQRRRRTAGRAHGRRMTARLALGLVARGAASFVTASPLDGVKLVTIGPGKRFLMGLVLFYGRMELHKPRLFLFLALRAARVATPSTLGLETRGQTA